MIRDLADGQLMISCHYLQLFLILWYWYAVLTIAVCHRLTYRLIQMVWPAFRFHMLHMRYGLL